MQARYERKEQTYYSSTGGSSQASVRTSAVADDLGTIQLNYRSSMAPRAFRIQRSRPCGGGSSAGTRLCEGQRMAGGGSCLHLGIVSAGGAGGMGGAGWAGGLTPCGTSAIGAINTARQRDKDELVDLNDRFAQYVEAVRSLEAMNRMLNHELNQLRNRTGQTTSNLEGMYEIEIVEARKLIDDTAKDATEADRRKQLNAAEFERMQGLYRRASGPRKSNIDEIEALQRQIADNDAKIALLRRRLADLEDELRIYKGETQRLSSEINRVNNDIHCEKLLRAACESETASADNEMECLKQMYEEELNEIRSKNMVTSSEPSILFKKRLVQAIQQIRSEYESTIGNFRQSLKLRYKVLTDQHSTVSVVIPATDSEAVLRTRMHEEWLSIRNSNEHLRARNRTAENSLADAKQRLADILERGRTETTRYEQELQILTVRQETVEQDYREVQTSRVTLEEEIAQYRRLLASQTTFEGYITSSGVSSSNIYSRGGSENQYSGVSGGFSRVTKEYYSSGNLGSSGNIAVGSGSAGGSSTYQRFESGSRRVEGSSSNIVRQTSSSNYSSRENIIGPSVSSPQYTSVGQTSLTSRGRASYQESDDDDN